MSVLKGRMGVVRKTEEEETRKMKTKTTIMEERGDEEEEEKEEEAACSIYDADDEGYSGNAALHEDESNSYLKPAG